MFEMEVFDEVKAFVSPVEMMCLMGPCRSVAKAVINFLLELNKWYNSTNS